MDRYANYNLNTGIYTVIVHLDSKTRGSLEIIMCIDSFVKH